MEVVPFIVSRYTSIAAVNSTVHHLLQDDVSTLRLPRFFPCPLVHVSRLLPGVWICLRPYSSTSRPIPWAGCPSHLTPAIRLSPSQYQSRLTPGSDWTFNFQNIFHTGWRREEWDNSVSWRKIPVPCWTLWLFCRVCLKKQSIASGVNQENNAEQCSPNISCILFFISYSV